MLFLEGARFLRDLLPGVISEVEMASLRARRQPLGRETAAACLRAR
jgi:hypothetical protein